MKISWMNDVVAWHGLPVRKGSVANRILKMSKIIKLINHQLRKTEK